MGNDNLFLLKRLFPLLSASVAGIVSFLPLRGKLTDFCLENMPGVAQPVSSPTTGGTLGMPTALKAHGGWVITQVLLRETWEVRFGSQGKPFFFPNMGPQEHP